MAGRLAAGSLPTPVFLRDYAFGLVHDSFRGFGVRAISPRFISGSMLLGFKVEEGFSSGFMVLKRRGLPDEKVQKWPPKALI